MTCNPVRCPLGASHFLPCFFLARAAASTILETKTRAFLYLRRYPLSERFTLSQCPIDIVNFFNSTYNFLCIHLVDLFCSLIASTQNALQIISSVIFCEAMSPPVWCPLYGYADDLSVACHIVLVITWGKTTN